MVLQLLIFVCWSDHKANSWVLDKMQVKHLERLTDEDLRGDGQGLWLKKEVGLRLDNRKISEKLRELV